MMHSNSSMLKAALTYAGLGYPVFACIPGKKKPITEHGLLDATTDASQIEKWWSEHPLANIGIRTNGLVVIDVDGADNPWLGDQDERWADLAHAPSSITPRGGRHYWFRQPAGSELRSSQSRLAAHVDTRANGGYIIVPPSVVQGRPYRWVEGCELEVGPGWLPEPPSWLMEALAGPPPKSKPAQQTSEIGNRIPTGQRNATLTSLSGTMRRAGMMQAEIAAAIRQVNADRCTPPLDPVEVDRISASVAKYPPALIASPSTGCLSLPARVEVVFTPKSLRELMIAHSDLREPLIHGLLRRGETMNIIAPSKVGKSWLVIDLALAVASGTSWLGKFQTVAGDVLIMDNELHGETSANRIPRVATARHVPVEAVQDRLFVKNLRGQLTDVFSLSPFFESITPGRFKMIVLDAFYRFMPRDMNENDNGTMANVYNYLDLYAERLGCCFVLIHHSSKGSQSGKAVTDVGAGAGSQSRATDSHLVLRPHQQQDVVVLEAAVRSWPPVAPQCLRWAFPVWSPASDLDPTKLKNNRPKRAGNDSKTKAWDETTFAQKFISVNPTTRDEIIGAARNEGLSVRQADSLLRSAESKKIIHRWHYSSNVPVRYSTVPKSGASNELPLES